MSTQVFLRDYNETDFSFGVDSSRKMLFCTESDFCVFAVVVRGSFESLCQFFNFFRVVFFTFHAIFGIRNCDSNFFMPIGTFCPYLIFLFVTHFFILWVILAFNLTEFLIL